MPNKTKTIQVQYFAILREQRGESREILTCESSTPEQLYQTLQKKHAFTVPVEMIRVSVNQQFKPMNTELQDQDHLVFIPPVAGG